MKRASGYLLLALVVTALLASAAALAWLGGTEEGVRRLLAVVSSHSQVKITAVRVEGRLLDHLSLAGVRIISGRVVTEMDSIDLRWHPLFLLSGRIAVKELTLHGVRIKDNTPPSGKPPELAWPRLPAIYELIEGKIKALRVKGLSYRRTGGEPLLVDSISAAVGWRFRLLSLSDLAIASPSGSVKGKIAAGFSTPFLKTNLVIMPVRPAAGIDRLSIQARLFPGRGKEQLAGKFAISAGAGSRPRMELAGETGLSIHSLTMRHLRLTAPGRRGAITGEGVMDLSAMEPSMTLKLRGDRLDLSPETGMNTDLSGNLDVVVNMDEYRGSFSFVNKGKEWRGGAMNGRFRGNGRGMKVTALNARLLEGTARGEVGINWQRGIAVNGTLSGSNLNPARIDPQWKGELNFDLSGNVARQGTGPLNWDVDARLRESRLHGQALTGEVRADAVAGNLRFQRLFLKGRGFDINGAGELKRRVDLEVRVSDLSRLLPGTAGEMKADGWMRWQGGRGAGSISLHGKGLAARGARAAAIDLAARLDDGKGYPLHLKAKLRKVSYQNLAADSVTVAADGTLMSHTLSTALFADKAELRLSLSGGYDKGLWQGNIVRLSGHDDVGPWAMEGSARLSVGSSRTSITPLVIRGVGGEHLQVAGELVNEPRRGELRLEWGEVNLTRARRWLNGVRVTGSSSGDLRLSMQGEERLNVAGNAGAAGTVTTDGKSLTVERSMMKIAGNEQGIHATLELNTTGGGEVSGTFSSASPARPVIPDQGEIALDWKGVDLLLIRPWLPDTVKIDGVVAGRAKGKILPGRRLDMEGEAALSRGNARWRNPGGEVNLDLRSAHVKCVWRGENIDGNADLYLADYGEVRGSFRLPLPAGFPIAIAAEGEIQASLTGEVREKGLLTALFPGFIRESSGELKAELRAGGRWAEPLITGNLHLDKAGAYLPSAGIQVKDVQLNAHLEKGLVRIDSLRAASGPGHLVGSAAMTLKGWQVTGYGGKIDGEGFQTVYFPELQLKCTPHLTFEGTPEKLSVRGEVRLPELLINGPPTSKVVGPSSDVVVEGRQKPTAKKSPLALDVRVSLLLGDKVIVKTSGINAQLAGKMDLNFTTLDRITSIGEIRVVKGSYKTYGVNLDIVRGRLYYAGGPINRPSLDFLALRTIGNVRAGVTVGGVLQAPVTKLYSDPSMADVDILAYIVLGNPLGSASGTSQTALLAQAAGALLSASQATDLQGEIKGRLGLSTLGFETDSGGTTGSIGYKTIPLAPPGKTVPVTTASESLFTVGKYLTPKLYLSYGRSLFTGGNLFRLRYDIYKHWQIETQTGAESGGDIFYSIEFD